MQTGELYRQRADECVRLANKKPSDRDQLLKVAETWRQLAKAADELSEAEKALH